MQKGICERAAAEITPRVALAAERDDERSRMSALRNPRVAYSEDLASQILDLIENGETLSSISRMDGMPSRNTLRKWTRGEGLGVAKDFPERFEMAIRVRLEGFVDDLLQIPREADPNHPGELARAKLECDNRRWLLSKMIPERFGERSQLELGTQLSPATVGELEQLRQERQRGQDASERLAKNMTDEEREFFRKIVHRQLQEGDV